VTKAMRAADAAKTVFFIVAPCKRFVRNSYTDLFMADSDTAEHSRKCFPGDFWEL